MTFCIFFYFFFGNAILLFKQLNIFGGTSSCSKKAKKTNINEKSCVLVDGLNWFTVSIEVLIAEELYTMLFYQVSPGSEGMFFFVFGIIVENEVNKKGFCFVVDLGFNKHESKRNKEKKRKCWVFEG